MQRLLISGWCHRVIDFAVFSINVQSPSMFHNSKRNEALFQIGPINVSQVCRAAAAETGRARRTSAAASPARRTSEPVCLHHQLEEPVRLHTRLPFMVLHHPVHHQESCEDEAVAHYPLGLGVWGEGGGGVRFEWVGRWVGGGRNAWHPRGIERAWSCMHVCGSQHTCTSLCLGRKVLKAATNRPKEV